MKKLWLLFLAGATAAFALATTAPANVAVVVNIRVALSKTDLKPNPLMMGYQGVKFDKTGQDILDGTCQIKLHGEKYRLLWPDKTATAN